MFVWKTPAFNVDEIDGRYAQIPKEMLHLGGSPDREHNNGLFIIV